MRDGERQERQGPAPDFGNAHNLPPAPPDFYSREYFLGRCGGFSEFKAEGGRLLDSIRRSALELLAPKPGERVLDLGCGRGELCCAVDEAGAVSIGVDFSRDALTMAQETAARLGRRVLLVRCRAEALPFKSESLNAVLATDIVEHLPDPDLRLTVREVRNALAPGGRFIVHTAPTREFMAVGQHLKRAIQRLKGEEVAPVLTLESELREAGHSNIHSFASLRDAMATAFASPRVFAAFSDPGRSGRGLVGMLGLARVLGFNLWAVARREGHA
jgi:2-polyprenyl-3-methyl-5-hydroxy-6-metoxy-1,4-benzoquinol methylase